MSCINCGSEIYTPDDRTGLIHTSGKYGCLTEKGKWMGTVAEEGGETIEDFEDHSSHPHGEFVFGLVCII